MKSMARQQASCGALEVHQLNNFSTGALWLYDHALAAIKEGIVITDARKGDNPIIYCNSAFLEITGYSYDEVIGRNWCFFQGLETEQEAVEQLHQAIQTKQECQVVLKNFRKDGTISWNELKMSPIQDTNGVVTHFASLVSDVTEQKLEQYRQQLMAFSIKSAVDAVFYIRPDASFFDVNEAACHLLGYSREELLTMSLYDIDLEFTPEIWQTSIGNRVNTSLSSWEAVKQRGITLETQHRAKDGQFIPVETTLNYLKFNDQEYCCIFARNISHRKHSEAALKKSKEQYRTLAKNFPNGAVLLFDQNLRYLIAEGVELASVGHCQTSLEGKTLWEAFTPEVCQAFEPAYRAALVGKTTRFEYTCKNQAYLVFVLPVTNEDGEISAGMVMTQNITELKQAEQDLQRSNALMKAQQESALDGILVIDEKRALTSYNRRFCQMWDIPETAWHTGNKTAILNFMLPLIAQPQQVFSQMQYLEEHPTLISRDEIYLNNGRVFDCYSSPAISSNGECYGRIWSFRDITERKQTEAALRQQAEREQLLAGMNQRIRQSLNLMQVLNTAVAEVRQFLECDRTIIYRFHPDWSGTIDVESVAPGWTPALGTTIEDTCFKENQASFYQQGRVRAIDDIYKAGLSPCHIQLLERFQVRANLVVPILQGDQLWGLMIAYQCSGSRHWQKSEVELLRQLSVQLGIAIQQAALFKQVADELKERKAAESALRRSKTALKKQATQLKKALQELQQAQMQLIQTEKMSSLGQLVAGVAHEINNPVTFIYGNITHADKYTHDLLELVQLYTKYYPKPVPEIEDLIEAIDLDFLVEDFPKLLSSMNMGVNRIHQIVLSLKNFSRLDEAERKPVDIHEGLENTLLILQHRLKPEAANIELIRDYGKLPLVECYPGQLNQVFMNILNNAIDALEKPNCSSTNSRGKTLNSNVSQEQTRTIEISTEIRDCSDAESANPQQTKSTQCAVIRIADNGTGIPKDTRKRIFDPFFTTKAVGEGTGLGLSISYQIIVEKHGGQLSCISTPGKGTEFIVEIPLTSQL